MVFEVYIQDTNTSRRSKFFFIANSFEDCLKACEKKFGLALITIGWSKKNQFMEKNSDSEKNSVESTEKNL